ncbi:CoA-acylating methylmalonate-semialdehyde dehydrogenase [Euzebya sp.]|uniref:CoA-acylating methylmalonate-semialdehyde dehydrogenase n=1 Tax=Euzebya sp. TaxID=1971409 RepID=UPI0035151EBF
MTTTIPHWIGGRAVVSASGRTAPVHNPATGRQTGTVGLADDAEVDAAVASALVAAASWRDTSLAARTEIMFRFRDLVDAHRDDLAATLTAEHGKVLSDAAGEVARGLENIEFACGLAHLLKGEHSEQVSGGVDVHSVRHPLGVMAGITPFNFPAMVPLWMFPTAIACGNAFVLKPSEKDPSVTLLLARLLAEAGLPDGVLTVVQGDRVAADRLLAHPDVAAVSFVGSTPVARSVYATAAAAGKRVQALGGAKNHMVVMPDADLDVAADAAVSAAYGSAGERCMAISVVVAVGDAADPLVAGIDARIDGIVVGDGTDPATGMGPLITAAHRDRVAGYVAAGEAEGATVVRDGRGGVPAEGFFLAPSLLDDVTPEMSVYRDEIFGPVLCVLRAPTYADAVALVNANPWGNGAAIFTRDGGAARRFGRDVTAGMVGVNVPIPVPVASYSFGGWDASLFGDLAIYGPDGIRFCTRQKVITSRWPAEPSAVDLGFPRTR